MTMIYKCDVCGRTYNSPAEANACEQSETITSATVVDHLRDKANHPTFIDVVFDNGDEARYISVVQFGEQVLKDHETIKSLGG
jgi:hypothetical protein